MSNEIYFGAETENKHFDVGLVGWWFASNYGSAMTYYGLGKILEDMNLSSLMIQIPKLNNTPWEPQVKKTMDFMGKYFSISNYRPVNRLKEYNDLCDTFMLGSDQLWTKSAIDLVGYTFFLDFAAQGKKKIAFATSFGHEKFSGTDEQKANASAILKTFDYISVRERSGIKASQENFGIEVQRDLDPVFICDVKHYDALADKSSLNDEDYLLCYILDPTEEKQAAIKYAAEKLNLKIIALLDMKTEDRRKAEWYTGDLRLNPSIEDFIYYFKHCKFLITDSHHGVCFGIIYNKNFISIANYSRGVTRFTHLLDLFELSDKLIYEPNKIIGNENVFKEINYEKVNEILRSEKMISIERLKEALRAKPKNIPIPVIRNSAQEETDRLHSNPDFKKIRILATLLRDYGVKHIVLSPGGRDVPLVRMFEYNEESFVLHRVTDERSAAYFGMGIATQLRQPVACVCTSGTAASNYLPAVTEAYYTGIPLIVITADRYAVYHEQGEDQTIPQSHIYDGVVKKSVTVPEGSGYQAEYQTRRDISDCILEATHNSFGPTHINIAVDNITVGAKAPRDAWKLLPKIYPHILRVSFNNGEKKLTEWVDAMKRSPKILVVYGQNPPASQQQKNDVEAFAKKYNCIIVTDHISNLNCAYSLSPYNMLQAISQQEFNEKLSPDILITVGRKRLMNDPLTFKVRHGLGNIRHWSVTPDGKIKDFYFRLSSVIEMSQDKFFEWFSKQAGDIRNNGVYYEQWRALNEKYNAPEINEFNSGYIQSRFLPVIPQNSMLHLGVGMTFINSRRYHIDPSVDVYCNMGTNGIDGCTSTFMGQCSVVKDRLCFLMVGDLSFFYDMNSIWNKELSKNIRILMVNNNGTGLLRGHGLKAISSVHNTAAKGWVESTGFEYISAKNGEEYQRQLEYFVSDKPQKAVFFEVFCG